MSIREKYVEERFPRWSDRDTDDPASRADVAEHNRVIDALAELSEPPPSPAGRVRFWQGRRYLEPAWQPLDD
jgi:hypothetical protein